MIPLIAGHANTTMKTQFKKSYNKVLSAFNLSLKKFNDMASVKGGRALIRWGTMFLPVIGLSTTSAKVRSIVLFLRKLSHYYIHNGRKGACLILKVYAVILQQSIGGHIVKDLGLLKFRVRRTRKGLPRIIPKVHREMINSGDTKIIRFWLTLFNFYRVIEFQGDYRYSSIVKTIISPAATAAESFLSIRREMFLFIPMFYKWLTRVIGMNPRSLQVELSREYRSAKAFPILKASPFTNGTHKFEDLSREGQQEAMLVVPVVSTHPIGIHEAAIALNDSPELREPTRYFLDLLPEGNVLRKMFVRCNQFPLEKGIPSIISQTEKPHWFPANAVEGTVLKFGKAFNPTLGKLSLKAESAGKVRVFAMVDCWTQWLLKPLHSVIFDHILAGIPQDGTLDQLAPIHRLLKTDPSSLFSLDLSAATDRLPLWLQEALMAGMVNKEYARNWASLLVDRDYSISIPHPKTGYGKRYKVRYAVGQPMGALSSWASLALTHHFIVQFCAYRVGFTKWFTGYAVLGDDLVISNPNVAKQYLNIMRVLGVGIGLHKSLLSGAGVALEFAKRTYYKGVDVSPIPLTELIACFNSPSSAVLVINKYGMSLASFLKAAGFGFRVLGQLNKPLGRLSSKVRLIILAMNIPITSEDVESFFSLGLPKSGKARFETQAVIDQLVSKEFKLVQRACNAIRAIIDPLEGRVLHAKEIAKTIAGRLLHPVTAPHEQELVDWAQAQLDQRTHLDHWVKGEGFIMSPVYEDSLGILFGQELAVADANPELVLQGAKRMLEAAEIRNIFPLVKELQYMVQGASVERARLIASAVKEEATRVMLAKYEMTAAEMYIALIQLQKQLALAPMANLKYSLIIDVPKRSFSDGTHIRLWKALGGLAQKPKQLAEPPKVDSPSKEEYDPFGWFS
jgi:hypothetical protein